MHKHRGTGRGASAEKIELKKAVRAKHEVLQRRYQAELNEFITPDAVGKNRGSALTSAERGITVAQRHSSRQLHVASTAKAKQLALMARGINFVGNKLIVLDAGIRMKGVHDTHQSGGDWQRKFATETTGFGFGGAAGLVTGKAVIGGLTALGLGITPVGWVVIIGVGAAAAYVAATEADSAGKKIANWIYDRGQ